MLTTIVAAVAFSNPVIVDFAVSGDSPDDGFVASRISLANEGCDAGLRDVSVDGYASRRDGGVVWADVFPTERLLTGEQQAQVVTVRATCGDESRSTDVPLAMRMLRYGSEEPRWGLVNAPPMNAVGEVVVVWPWADVEGLSVVVKSMSGEVLSTAVYDRVKRFAIVTVPKGTEPLLFGTSPTVADDIEVLCRDAKGSRQKLHEFKTFERLHAWLRKKRPTEVASVCTGGDLVAAWPEVASLKWEGWFYEIIFRNGVRRRGKCASL